MKKIVIILCTFIVCLSIGLALLPSFLSTSIGKSSFLAIVNATSDAALSIDNLQLSWSQGQAIDNFQYQDKHSKIHIQKINTNAPLTQVFWRYLKDQLHLLEANTEILNAQYTFTPENEESAENTLNPVTLSNINAKWQYPNEENTQATNIHPLFSASGITKQGELQGRFEIEAVIEGQHPKKLISHFIKMAKNDESTLNVPKNTELKLNAKLLDVPVLALERSLGNRHPEWKGVLKDTLGDILSLSLKYQVNPQSQDYHLQLKAPKSEVDIKGTFADNIVLIDKGSYSHFTLTPKLFHLLCPSQKLELTQASTIHIDLENGSLPLDATHESINLLDANLKGKISTPKLAFNDKGALSQFNLNDFDIEFNGSLNNGLNILQKYRLQLLKTSVWSELLGSTLEISAHGRILLSHQNLDNKVLPIPLKVDPFVLSVNSSELQLSLEGKMNDRNQIELTAPIAVHYEGTQKALDWLKKEKQWNFSTQAGPVNLTMEPIIIDLGKNLKTTLSKINLQGQLSTDHLNIRYPKNAKDELPISDLAIQWAFKGNERRAQLQFKANHGPSESLEANIALLYDGTALVQAKDHVSGITWSISPNRFATLRQMVHDYLHEEEPINDAQKKLAYVPYRSKLLTDVVLKENFPLDININALRIPIKQGPQKEIENYTLDFSNTSLQMNIGAHHLAFFEREQNKLWSFDTFSMNVNSSSIKDGFQFNMKIKESPLAGQKKPLSTLDVTGNLNHVFDPEKLNFQITVHGKQTPVPFLSRCSCAVKGMEKQIEAILGQRVDMDISGAFYPRKQTGNINAKLKGLQGSLILDGYVTEGMLYLNAPLSAELTVTPQLSQTFLDAVMPILNSAVSNTQPITIGIDHRGFAMPLDLSRKDKISIPIAAIDLGQMEFSPHGQLGQVLSFLNPKKEQQQQQYSPPKSHSIWFTPLYFSIANQIIQCERMDLLADNRYPLAIWGKVNLAKDEVNMKIALTAEALRQSLDAKDIPNSAILLLPLKGTMSNASIDKSKAMKEIAALVAHSHGGPEGMIIGTVLELLNGGPKKKKVPEPTTQPFPWAK